MAAKLTRLTQKIAIQLNVVTESCTICSSRSRWPVRKLLGKPQYSFGESIRYLSEKYIFVYHISSLRISVRLKCNLSHLTSTDSEITKNPSPTCQQVLTRPPPPQRNIQFYPNTKIHYLQHKSISLIPMLNHFTVLSVEFSFS
jgi:hypothetical protein